MGLAYKTMAQSTNMKVNGKIIKDMEMAHFG